MRRILRIASAVGMLLLAAPIASANAGPPRPRPTEPAVPIAAVIGAAGAVLAGFWIVRRPKP